MLKHEINAVLTKEHLDEVVAAYMEFDAFAFDTETKASDPAQATNFLINEVTWVSLAGPGRADAIPVAHVNGPVIVPTHKESYEILDPKGGEYQSGPRKGEPRMLKRQRTVEATFGPPPKQLSPGTVFQALEPLFFSDRRKIGHNVKFDLKTIAKYYDWWVPPPPYGETTSLHHLLNENRMNFRLITLAQSLIGAKYPKIGSKQPHLHPFDDAARYAMKDAKYTWLLWHLWQDAIDAQGLRGVLDLEMDLIPVLVSMEIEGVPVERGALADLRASLVAEADEIETQIIKDIRHTPKARSFNFSANADKGWYIYEHRGHEVEFFTKKTGQPSTAAAHLERYAKRDKMVSLLLDHAKIEKMRGTYADGIAPLLEVDGRLHADFVAYGTVTGRMSCVSGSTLLDTTRGTFRFDEYMPVEGDLVRTHEGRLQPVLRKIYKGRQPMRAVHLSNECRLECTDEHRLLGPTGWVYVRDLRVGDKVYSDDSIPSLCERPSEGAGSARPVPGSPHEADAARDSESPGHVISERTGSGGSPRAVGSQAIREDVAVLAGEGWGEEPDAPQEWLAASRFQGRHPLEGRVPAAEGRQQVRTGAPTDDGRGAGSGPSAQGMGGTSHQRGQVGQPSRQLRPGDPCGPRAVACQAVEVVEISDLGAMGVWDIEVAEDHSYVAHGFFNHNCRDPNLQNFPRVDDEDEAQRGLLIRRLFVAPEGHSFVAADYDQIELRVLAHFSRDPTLVNIFKDGLDPHAGTAAQVLGIGIEDVTKAQRQAAKSTNFLIMYGGGAGRLAEQTGMGIRAAKRFLETYWQQFPRVQQFAKGVVTDARRRRPPYTCTDLNRRRRLPELFATDDYIRFRAERQAVNAKIQGTSADIIKIAMVEHRRLAEGTPHKLVLSIHDELIALSPDDRIEEGKEILEEAMLGPSRDGLDLVTVPLKAKAVAAKRWADTK